MHRLITPFIFLLIVFTSCKKNKDENCFPPEPAKAEFVACNCSEDKEGAGGEYIKAEINGVQICADIKGMFGDYPFGNMLKYGNIIRDTGNQYYDNLYMIRRTKDDNVMFSIFLENTHALTKQYPYELPRANPEVCEIGELQLENLKQPSPSCFTCPENKWHYYSPFFGDRLKLYADRFENGFFEGRFEGIVNTGSGRGVWVKKGAFRIKLTLLHQDYRP